MNMTTITNTIAVKQRPSMYGFQKKTQKTPSNEIEKADKLMKEYFDNKK